MTPDRMRHARDAEDALLLESGDHETLVAAYAEIVLARCRVGAGWDGDDVAQDVFMRLLAELGRGKRYPVPFRVVVHKVVDWTLRDHWAGRRSLPLPDDWDPAVEEAGFGAVEERLELESLFADLPDVARNVLELRYLRGLEPTEIAAELDMQRNAVDQALHRGHAKLRERIDAA